VVYSQENGQHRPEKPPSDLFLLAAEHFRKFAGIKRLIIFPSPVVVKSVMYFSQTPHTGPVPSADSLKALDAYFAWRRTPEGEASAK